MVDKRRTSKFIDFAVPGDSRTQEKKRHKIEKYQNIKGVAEDF